MAVYEPGEDSELLKQAVEQYAFGEVLDMGSGSGFLALAAATKKEVTNVLAVDIDDESLEHVRNKVKNKKIKVLRSNLFSNLKNESFDTIIFNPPYLPKEEKDEHQALYGGAEGYELTLQFLEQAKKHLKPQGIILLLFSSLTNKERIDQEAKKLGYHFEQLLMEAHFFERLYVYKLWRLGDG